MISERERERGDGITVSLWCVFVWERASPRVVAFAGRVGEWAALCAAAMDEAAFQVWLGAEVVLESGYKYALPARVKAILAAAFAAKDVDVDDVIKIEGNVNQTSRCVGKKNILVTPACLHVYLSERQRDRQQKLDHPVCILFMMKNAQCNGF